MSATLVHSVRLGWVRSALAAATLASLACGASPPELQSRAFAPGCPGELAQLEVARDALDRGEIPALPSASECPAAQREAALLRAEANALEALLAAPTVGAAGDELAKAAGASGAQRRRALSRARLLLERMTKSHAEPVVWRAPYLLPGPAPLETAPIAGTNLSVVGEAAVATPTHAYVIEKNGLVRYAPEPKVLLGSAQWPLEISAHYARAGLASNIRFADLASESPLDSATAGNVFFLPDGSNRVVEAGKQGVRLVMPRGATVVLDPRDNNVIVDDVAGRIVSYWPLGPLSPSDAHVLELSVFDARDGRRIVRSTDPPKEAMAAPVVSVSPDGAKLVVMSTSEAKLLTFFSNRWTRIGGYQLENLGGGAFKAAFTPDGAHVCAAWGDTFHLLPNDVPRGAELVCTFEARTPFHTDARIGCVQGEKGWVTTRSGARAVTVTGAAVATGVRKVVALQHEASVDPLPGGLNEAPEVAVRLVVADADTCKIERRIPLGRRRLESGLEAQISADGSIVALSGEAFEVSSGNPTEWSPKGTLAGSRSVRGSRAATEAAFGLKGIAADRLESTGDGIVRLLDANRQVLVTMFGTDAKNRAVVFADRSHRFEGDHLRDARCRFGSLLAPIELCPEPAPTAALDEVLRRARQ